MQSLIKYKLPRAHGRFQPIIRHLETTFNFGYLCGLVLGDGYLFRTKNRNYRVSLESTDEELATLFVEVARNLGFNPLGYKRAKLRSFKSGYSYSNESWVITINSKQLYYLLRPFKKEDFLWQIPIFLVKKKEAILGFLSGLFDAEGTVDKKGLALSSKRIENVKQIQIVLSNVGIKSRLYVTRSSAQILTIREHLSKQLFQRLIGFRLQRKNVKLQKIMEKTKRWKLEELEVLKKEYGKVNTIKLAQKIGRTVSSIHHKVSRLNNQGK